MPELSLYQIDAFTRQVFKGNPAGVVPLDSWPPDALLQNIAAENNLAETAFFVQVGETYELRWFTPVHEAPLCGHATLGAAYVLFNELGYSGNRIHFKANLSDLFVQRDGDLLVLDFPAVQYEACPDYPEALINGLGKQPKEVYVAHADPNYYAIFDHEADVLELQPNLSEIARTHPYGVVASAPGNKSADCVSRYFAPSYGIPEDPVTGSIHCVLVPFWGQQFNKTKIHALQASARTGELFCEQQGDRVLIAGYAKKYLSGTIYV